MPPAPSPITWSTVEDALHDWLSGATGLTTIWAQQDAPRPAYPFATLSIIAGPTRVGGVDEIRYTYDSGQPLGQEVEIEAAGLREITVSCQAFVAAGTSQTQNRVARDTMCKAQSSLGMPSVQAALRAAGLSVIEEGVVQNASAVDEDTWIGRASMDVRFRLAASVSERGPYVNQVLVSSQLDVDPDLELDEYPIGG